MSKVALVTGGSRGIGASISKALQAAGYTVAATYAGNDDAAKAFTQETGIKTYKWSVADYDACAEGIRQVEAEVGPVDVLVNNAGLIGPIADIAAADPDDWGQAIDVNLKGVFHGMRAALPVMRAQGGGTVLTVGSGAAHAPKEGWSAYCASKAGAWMLTRALDHEAGAQGIRAISLSPGTVATDMQRAIRDSGVNPVSQLDWSVHIPPEWPARALVWLCGPAGDAFLGAEVSLRDETIRRRLGLAP